MPDHVQVEQRQGEAYELDEHLTVLGRKLRPGELAPPFALECLDPGLGTIVSVRLADSAGRIRLLNVVNSLDTPVCDVATKRWEGWSAELPADVQLYTISMDLPFAQARWCGTANVQHRALSAHKDEQFGKDYGVLIREWRLLQRAVFVLDRDGNIVHAEYVPNQMAEPDYASAIAAVHQLT